MKLIRSISGMRQYSQKAKKTGRTIGFVPTMGVLHEGHLSLIRTCRKENDVSVISIFVNPAQFVKGEDLKTYPRVLKRDLALARKAGVDAVFYPQSRAIYPKGYRTYVEVEGLSSVLCGKSRPGHFKGVTTIVIKLFNIISPDIAYFGQKDAQQAVIIKKMVKDLNLPVRIKVLPTVRERDGLAMSSRNSYLNRRQRQSALLLSMSLRLARDLVKSGERHSRVITAEMRRLILKDKSARIDYIAIVDPENLCEIKRINNKALVALAVRIGRGRLIDNTLINRN